ncbi:MAG: GNAT family N-acetyltransferase [Candidatus Kapaibacterium sp.]
MLTIQRITSQDLSEFFELVEALATYEHLSPPDAAARSRFATDSCGERPRVDAYILRVSTIAVGYLILVETYSSFRAQPTLYIEDIFIREQHRSKGYGRRTIQFVLEQAVARQCGRIEWQVLNWNEPAIRFYESLGAERMSEWSTYRISAEQFSHITSRFPKQ